MGLCAIDEAPLGQDPPPSWNTATPAKGPRTFDQTAVYPVPVVYPMYNTPEEIRAKLKRLCPYQGASIPESVRQMGKGYWGPKYPEQHGHWFWDDGDGDGWQYVLHLCDMDVDTCNPAGHVAIIPLKNGKYRLNFVIAYGGATEFNPENLIFGSTEEAKRFLDRLLAFNTPEISRRPPA